MEHFRPYTLCSFKQLPCLSACSASLPLARRVSRCFGSSQQHLHWVIALFDLSESVIANTIWAEKLLALKFILIPHNSLKLKQVIDHLHQHLPCVRDEMMDLALCFRVNHLFWSTTIWAGHIGCCAKHSADQRSFLIHFTTIRPQMNAVPLS